MLLDLDGLIFLSLQKTKAREPMQARSLRQSRSERHLYGAGNNSLVDTTALLDKGQPYGAQTHRLHSFIVQFHWTNKMTYNLELIASSQRNGLAIIRRRIDTPTRFSTFIVE